MVITLPVRCLFHHQTFKISDCIVNPPLLVLLDGCADGRVPKVLVSVDLLAAFHHCDVHLL